MKIGKIVDRKYMSITEDSSVLSAASVMNNNHVYGLIVKDSSGKSVGMISERTLLRRFIARNEPAEKVLVKSVMRRPLPHVKEDMDIKDVAKYLSDNALTRCAVVDNNGKIIGITTITDLARYLSRETIHEVLLSHRNKEFRYICPRCNTGTMEPVYNHKGEISVFKCSEAECDYRE